MHMHGGTPAHYRNPARPSRPSDNSVSSGIDYNAEGTTRHWKSEYQSAGEEAGGALIEHRAAARGAIRHWPQQMPSCVGRPDNSTSHAHHFGRYGSNPRERIL